MPRSTGSKVSSSTGTKVTKAKSSGAIKSSSSSSKEIDELVQKTDKIKLEDRYVYRICRPDEDISKDIVCKAKQGTPEAERTVNQHINSGSKKASSYISATKSPDVARQWALFDKSNPKDVKEREKPRDIIRIDTSKMESSSKPIDLTDKSERERHVSGAIQINRAKSSQEVLFKDRIPKQNSSGENVFELWKDPPRPEKHK